MLSVGDDDTLKAAVLAVKAADRDLRRDIAKATRDTMNPVWRGLVQDKAADGGGLTARMLGGAPRIAAGNPPVAKAAQSARKVGRDLVPRADYGPWEFGVPDRNTYSRYERRNRKAGGYHVVKRRTMRGLPRRHPQGRVVYPAFAELAPRMVSLWVQLVVRKYHEAAEGKRS